MSTSACTLTLEVRRTARSAPQLRVADLTFSDASMSSVKGEDAGLAHPQLVEAVVVDAEVVGDLVDYGEPDLLYDLVPVGAHGLYGVLE